MNKELSKDEIKVWEQKIDHMTHLEMARYWRFAKSGHPLFRLDLPLYDRFRKRFNELGGMTVEVSKTIGWDYYEINE